MVCSVSRDYVKEKFKLLGTKTVYLRYPPWGIGNETITYILALDRYTGNTGGYGSIVGGGVGHKHVALSFKSQTNRGIKFIVEIYGK
jgi:hypothetical protein